MDKLTVLIVDDDNNIRELYTAVFEQADFNVLSASNGEEGVKLALENHPDIILMDIIMPEMDGHEAVKQIRRDKWGKTAKIMYLSNLSDPENMVNAMNLKSDEYIIKSNVEVSELVDKARQVMFSVRM